MNNSDEYLFRNIEPETIPEPKTNLGLISLILYGCGIVVPMLLREVFDYFEWYSISSLGETICGLISLASFVLMIYTRVKFPKDVFAKITMWLFIVTIAFVVLAVLFIIVACYSCTSALGNI